MDTQNTSNELELIKQQMELLKEKLASQEIVNEKLIISSMKKKMSWIKKYIIFEVGLLPFIAVMWLGIKMIIGLSWYNYAFMIIMCCIDVYIDYLVNLRGMKDSDARCRCSSRYLSLSSGCSGPVSRLYTLSICLWVISSAVSHKAVS